MRPLTVLQVATLTAVLVAAPSTVSSQGTAIQITSDPAYDQCPSWSPDGSSIAFESDRSGNWDIWTIPISPGGAASQLTTDPASDWTPAWSPDGAWIAFGSSRDDGSSAIWRMPSGGGSALRATFSSPGGYHRRPAWAPGSDRIAFSFEYAECSIYVVPMLPDGVGGHTRVTEYGGQEHSPSWSPDGDLIAYAADGDIWVIRPSGEDATRLTVGTDEDGCPAWSPDGHYIAYTCDSGICVMPSTGGAVIRLTSHPPESACWDRWPSWSPDGGHIAFSRFDLMNAAFDIWMVPWTATGIDDSAPVTWGNMKAMFR